MVNTKLSRVSPPPNLRGAERPGQAGQGHLGVQASASLFFPCQGGTGDCSGPSCLAPLPRRWGLGEAGPEEPFLLAQPCGRFRFPGGAQALLRLQTDRKKV